MKHIERHAPELTTKIAGIETVDHPTDNQLLAYARQFFHADHQMPPRV